MDSTFFFVKIMLYIHIACSAITFRWLSLFYLFFLNFLFFFFFEFFSMTVPFWSSHSIFVFERASYTHPTKTPSIGLPFFWIFFLLLPKKHAFNFVIKSGPKKVRDGWAWGERDKTNVRNPSKPNVPMLEISTHQVLISKKKSPNISLPLFSLLRTQ